MNRPSRFAITFTVVMAAGAAMGGIMAFWLWLWPEAAFIGSVTTVSAIAFATISVFAE